jgi:hypothetical protein
LRTEQQLAKRGECGRACEITKPKPQTKTKTKTQTQNNQGLWLCPAGKQRRLTKNKRAVALFSVPFAALFSAL